MIKLIYVLMRGGGTVEFKVIGDSVSFSLCRTSSLNLFMAEAFYFFFRISHSVYLWSVIAFFIYNGFLCLCGCFYCDARFHTLQKNKFNKYRTIIHILQR